jgi:membrane protein insertase Oxa1/YidC/SpoIIIJ
MINLFTTYIYQPFFNLIIWVYYQLGAIGLESNFGHAVIIIAITIRIILLPLTLNSLGNKQSKDHLLKESERLRKDLAHDPVRLKKELKNLMRSRPKAIISEVINITIQIIIMIMLYRLFGEGIEGADFDLIYPITPMPKLPLNLIYNQTIDLTQPSLSLNLLLAGIIIILESSSLLFSTTPSSKKDFVSMVIILPLVSFFFFQYMPAGKTLFLIATLSFSLLLLLFKQLGFWYHTLVRTPDPLAEADKLNNNTQ